MRGKLAREMRKITEGDRSKYRFLKKAYKAMKRAGGIRYV
jgi:hypothetical protein